MKKATPLLNSIYSRVAKELNLSSRDVQIIYEAFWLYIKTKIQELPLKEDISEEEFNALQTNYRISGLGIFHCKYNYKKLKWYNETFFKKDKNL